MHEKLAQGTLHSNLMLLCEYALGFLPTAASFFKVRKNMPKVLYTLTPCYYVGMLWNFYRVLQATMYEKLLRQTAISKLPIDRCSKDSND